MYTPLAVSCATLLAELPYVLVQTSFFVPVVYFMIDFQHDVSLFWYYYLMTFCCLMMYTSLGMFLVSIQTADSFERAFNTALLNEVTTVRGTPLPHVSNLLVDS